MTNKKRSDKNHKNKDNKIAYAFIATFLSIIGFVIALLLKKDDKYVMYYAKQSLVIFIIIAVIGVAGKIISFIPIIGPIINIAIIILSLGLWIISWIYAISGEEKELPIVSEWAEKFNF